MIDLDDVVQLQALDRNQQFVRAAHIDQRWPAAQAGLATLMQTIDLRPTIVMPPTVTIFLSMPPELSGVGQVVCTLFQQHALSNVILWDAQQSLPKIDAPHWWLSAVPLTALGPEREQNPLTTVVDLSSQISGDQHPAQVLLFLLALLEKLLHNAVSIPPWTSLLANPLSSLTDCAPTVPIAQNPAKQLALQLHERLPFFYGHGALAGIADDWRLRMLWYAEAMSWSASLHELMRIQVMARLPRYWFNIVTFVRLTASVAEQINHVASTPQPTKLDQLLTIRRLQNFQITAPDNLTAIGAFWHLLELGEWLALYTAALYNVDPADRVPLRFLEI